MKFNITNGGKNLIKKQKKKNKQIPMVTKLKYFFHKYHFASFAFDIGVVLVVLLFFVVSLTKTINFNCDFQNADIVLIVLPTILTIISIILQFRSEKIYGVTTKHFNKLRGSFYFDFLHIIVVFLLLNLFFLFAKLLKENNCCLIISLDLIAFVYSLIFVLQEIPILTMDDAYLNRVIKTAYKHNKLEFVLGYANKQNTLETILLYMILNDGIVLTYDCLKEKNNVSYDSNLFDNLMSIQNRFFWDIIENEGAIKAGIYDNDMDSSLEKNINSAFSNIYILTSSDKSKNYNSLFPKIDKTYHLTRLTFSLHRICNSVFDLNKKELSWINRIISSFIESCFSAETRDLNYPYILQMGINTIKEGDLWFYTALRDNNCHSSAIFSYEKCDIGLFLSFLLYFIYKNGNISYAKKEELSNFVKEKSKGLNSFDATWSKSLDYMLSYIKSDSDFVSRLLNIYKLINKCTYDLLTLDSDSGFADSNEEFDENFIINICLEIVILRHCDINDINKILDSISQKYESSVLDVISEKWLDCVGKFSNFEKHFDFLDFYSLTCFNDYKAIDAYEEYEKALFKFLNDRRTEKIQKETNECFKGTNLNEIKSHLISSLNNQIKTFSYFNEELENADFCKNYYCPMNLELYQTDFSIDSLSCYLKCEIQRLIREEINKFISRKVIEGESLTDETIKEFLDFDAINQSCKYSDLKKISEDVSKKIFELKNDSNGLMPNGVFWKDKFIEFLVNINEAKSFVRFLDDNEVNRIIDESYKIINGAYFYNEYSNDDTKGILLSREELFDILKKKRIFVVIFFELKMKIDSSKYLAYSLNPKK